MKKKIILYSIGNKNGLNYYTFDKSKEAIWILASLFYKFGIEIMLREDYDTPKGKWKKRDINFNKRYDMFESFWSSKHKNFDVLIFYGKKRIFVVLNCSEKLREKFNKELAKITIASKLKKGNKPKSIRSK